MPISQQENSMCGQLTKFLQAVLLRNPCVWEVSKGFIKIQTSFEVILKI